MRVSCAVILCYAIFPLSLIRSQRLERVMYSFAYGRNYHSRNLRCKFADNLTFNNCLRIAVILTLNSLTEREMGTGFT